jgi:hypothetical protein
MRPGVVSWTSTCSGVPSVERLTPPPLQACSSWNTGRLALPIEEGRRRRHVPVVLDLRPHDHELLGIVEGQGASSVACTTLKIAVLAPDAEGQGQQRDAGEAGIAPEQAKAEAGVANQSGSWASLRVGAT